MGEVCVSVPAWDTGLPPGVVRLKARLERERERAENKRLTGALDALIDNQRRLASIVTVAERGEGQAGTVQ